MASIDLKKALTDRFPLGEKDGNRPEVHEAALIHAFVAHVRFDSEEEAQSTLDFLMELLKSTEDDGYGSTDVLLRCVIMVAKQVGALSAREKSA